ncbi:hypothetical protein DSO57_1008067 [Entomophthora muscae]|uniref:Uncharacterized protein n=1 Tax=Entomophthora muscae TaxID=34485 RepID=A0ACC2S948_9FUNG|nr:hypothetical protein DSO57_1008067 [Entomophthora muscae]
MSHALQKMPQNPSLMPPAESLRLSRRFRKILKNLMEWLFPMETCQDLLGPDKDVDSSIQTCQLIKKQQVKNYGLVVIPS